MFTFHSTLQCCHLYRNNLFYQTWPELQLGHEFMLKCFFFFSDIALNMNFLSDTTHETCVTETIFRYSWWYLWHTFHTVSLAKGSEWLPLPPFAPTGRSRNYTIWQQKKYCMVKHCQKTWYLILTTNCIQFCCTPRINVLLFKLNWVLLVILYFKIQLYLLTTHYLCLFKSINS